MDKLKNKETRQDGLVKVKQLEKEEQNYFLKHFVDCYCSIVELNVKCNTMQCLENYVGNLQTSLANYSKLA